MHVIGHKPSSSGGDSEPEVGSLNGLASKWELGILNLHSPMCAVTGCENMALHIFMGILMPQGAIFLEQNNRKSVLLIIFQLLDITSSLRTRSPVVSTS